MHDPVEAELIEATEFKPAKNYKNRQDYLAALLIATTALTDDEFEGLSDAAADWTNFNARAHRAKQTLSDFEIKPEEPVLENGPTDEPPAPEEMPEAAADGLLAEPKKKRSYNKVTQKGTPLTDYTGEIDKWGLPVGTKQSAVATLFEQGTTMRAVKDMYKGVTFYNMLRRLSQEGHKIEKDGSTITLIYKGK